MRLTHLAVATVVATLATPAFAGSVPPQVMNRTISVSFAATGEAKAVGELMTHGFSTQVSVIIYVSSAGRLFFRKRIANSYHSSGKDIAPGEGRGSASFQGNRLIGVVPFEAGARQITVTFDPGFTSCTASIIEGHGSGGVIRRRGADGAMYEVTSASTSSPSCSIQSGNAFAG